MDSLRRYVAVSAALGVLVACGGGGSATEDERGSVGVPPTAPEYCAKLGFALVDTQCAFPDGTSCEVWAFYRGQCGQAHSYCNQHGGSVSSKTVDMGTWTAIYGVCDLNGKQCDEVTFFQTAKCP